MALIARNVRNSLIGGILAAAPILAVGCGSLSSSAADQASRSASAVHSSASAVSAPSCLTSNLRISLGDGGAAAGTDFTVLDFTNSGTAPCTLYGFPGVSLLNSSGGQIGAAATRNPAKASTKITLAPGAEASAALGVANAQNYPKAACEPTSAVKLKVFPPNQAQAVEVSFATTGCGVSSTRQLNITAVTAGAGRAVQG
jgi:Protein of unknown function (DUF4232)